ncbi:polysaccharide lyase 8 family protein [Aliivibrio fischeri]|uniref:polysaccharide lyase 8 family protein n=1 Tax=Aliivibrio fischeri TaxID=668 RepID=UPI00084CD26F|nr:polysaccharide lyase 8 family protein [Aliivibrio fischeri]OED53126.1 hyaluronate lyase [Aliivibrio fischeri]
MYMIKKHRLNTIALSMLFLFTGNAYAAKNTQTPQYLPSDFEQVRENWAENYLGDPAITFDQTLKNMVTSTNSSAQKHWDSMTPQPNASGIWDDLPLIDKDTTLGPNIRSSYQRLFTMAKAYRLRDGNLENNQLMLNDIMTAMNYINQNFYFVNQLEYGNWWQWELAIPKDIHNILVLLFDDIKDNYQTIITNHLNATRYFTPDPTHLGVSPGAAESTNPNYRESTGGNRTDNAQVVLIRGMLENNSEEISQAIAALPAVIEYVSEGDGYYTDGSFLQHSDIAYNGTYGNVLLGGLGIQMNAVAGSPWSMDSQTISAVYNIINQSYEPLLYKGAMMDMVNGRSISRSAEQNHDVGLNIVNSMLFYTNGPDSDKNKQLSSLIKTQIIDDTYQNFFDKIYYVSTYQAAQHIVNDPTVSLKDPLIGNFSYPSMDRVVHRRNDWAFALAMHSYRIGNYECMNGENLKGWFTGDGMTYLYNDQLDHYTGYWPTVNASRMPGTTVDSQIMADCSGERVGGNVNTNMQWVGSTSLNNYGIAGMQFYNWSDTLSAYKSWFMFDNEVVMLGSNIKDQSNGNNTTTIENRKRLADTKLFIDGTEQATLPYQGAPTTFSIRNKTLANSDLSYVMLTPKIISISQNDVDGNWSDIGNSKGDVSDSYLQATLTQVDQADYQYTLLPNQNNDTVQNYAQHPDVTVLRQDEQAHAVQENTLNIIAANNWKNSPVNITDTITLNSMMGFMIKEESSNTFTVAVSEPIQTIDSVNFIFDKQGIVIKEDIENRVVLNGTTLTINTSGLQGQSYSFQVTTQD